MYRLQILLNSEQQHALKEIAQQENRSVSDLIRDMVNQQLAERRKLALAAAAQALLSDYQNDPELTAFSVLDGDEFHAER
jgi:hypothetical protein